jgi:hypothetical protein
MLRLLGFNLKCESDRLTPAKLQNYERASGGSNLPWRIPLPAQHTAQAVMRVGKLRLNAQRRLKLDDCILRPPRRPRKRISEVVVRLRQIGPHLKRHLKLGNRIRSRGGRWERALPRL